MNKKVFVGVDGCSAGWFAVFLTEADEINYSRKSCAEKGCNEEEEEEEEEGCNGKKCTWEMGLFHEFSVLWDFLKTGYGAYEPLVLIDIPIGLKAGGTGERLSDLGGRKVLKARKSSIFPVPCREAVYAETYEQACEVNERFTGKRISKQAWNILPKIRDVDGFLINIINSPGSGRKAGGAAIRDLIWEVGPEICFQAFAGWPMNYSKKKEEGFLERKEVLKKIEPLADETFVGEAFVDELIETALSRYRRKDVARDDILDALVAAFTAKIGQGYGFEYVPVEPEKDAEGIRIQLVYCNYFEKVADPGA